MMGTASAQIVRVVARLLPSGSNAGLDFMEDFLGLVENSIGLSGGLGGGVISLLIFLAIIK